MLYKTESLFHLKNLYQNIESAKIHFLEIYHTGKIQSQSTECRIMYLGSKVFKYLCPKMVMKN